jgi:hypothetical protein
VAIARGYRLEDRGIAARVPVESRMVSSGVLYRVALVRTDVSEELSASFIRTLFLVN